MAPPPSPDRPSLTPPLSCSPDLEPRPRRHRAAQARQHSVRGEAPAAAEAGMRERPHFPTAQHRAGGQTPGRHARTGQAGKKRASGARGERHAGKPSLLSGKSAAFPLSLLKFGKLFLCFTNCPPSTSARARSVHAPGVALPSPASKGVFCKEVS